MKKFDEAALVAAAIAGRPLKEVAAAAGSSVSTVQRRLKDPAVTAQVREGRSRQRDELVGQLAGLRTRAVARLSGLIDDAEPGVALRAISTVLVASARFDLVHELDQRLCALEQPNEDLAQGLEVPDDPDVDEGGATGEE